MSGLVDATQGILGSALDGLTERQTLISSNLANIDTPGYAPRAIDFETALRREVEAAVGQGPANATGPAGAPSAELALRTTDPRQIASLAAPSSAGGAAPTEFAGSLRNDGNKVDLETELTALTQTQLKYEAVSRLMTGKFNQLETVIGGQP